MQLDRTSKMLSHAFLLSLVSGCALLGLGGGSDKLKHAEGYRINAPPDWKSIDKGDSDHAYRLPSGDIATLTSSCNRDPNSSLELLTRHLLIGERNTIIARRERIPVDGKDGLFSDVASTLDGKSFHLNLFVLSSHGCIFDFSLVSPQAISETETHGFLNFVRSFHYGKS